MFQRRVAAAHRFEAEHKNVIKDYNFPSGRLVLMRNTAIEKSLNRKTRPRYIGPMVVVGRNRGGAYLLAELDGAVLDRPVAAFRLIPYFARKIFERRSHMKQVRRQSVSAGIGLDDFCGAVMVNKVYSYRGIWPHTDETTHVK